MNEAIGFAALIVSIFAGILFQNARLDRIESRLTDRIERMQSDLTGRMDRMDAKIDRMQSELSGRIDRIQGDLAQFFRELGRHDAKIESIEKKAS